MVLDLADVRRQGELLIDHAKKRAEAILAEARTERERLIAGAADKGREEGKARGFAEGRKTGLVQGKDAALKEFKPRLDALVESWNRAANGLLRERETILAEA